MVGSGPVTQSRAFFEERRNKDSVDQNTDVFSHVMYSTLTGIMRWYCLCHGAVMVHTFM